MFKNDQKADPNNVNTKSLKIISWCCGIRTHVSRRVAFVYMRYNATLTPSIPYGYLFRRLNNNQNSIGMEQRGARITRESISTGPSC